MNEMFIHRVKMNEVEVLVLRSELVSRGQEIGKRL